MSGALEVAAGAFAVVGVADVLLRTGRDLYDFLRDIEDAPNDLRRLCDVIQETLLLASASARCLQQLETRTQPTANQCVIDALRKARNALEREVKSVKTHTVKFKGNNSRWSNVRHVLNEQKIKKSVENIERAKTLMANALVLACRELGSLENYDVEMLVRRCVQLITSMANDLPQDLSAKLDTHEQTVLSHLGTYHQENLAAQASRQQALDIKLDARHQELTALHKVQSDSLMAIQSAHTSVASSQSRTLRTSMQTNRQTMRISQDLKLHTHASNKQHQTTRDLIVTELKNIRVAQTYPLPRVSSGRQIVYAGEGRDLIMPTLYSIEQDVNMVFEQLFADHCQDVSPSHIAFLQSEFQNLMASATQEKAASYPMSTATPFDDWIYPEATRRFTRGLENQGTPKLTTEDHGQASSSLPQKRPRRVDRVLTFNTSKGTLSVTLPQRNLAGKGEDMPEEVSFSLSPVVSGPFAALYARFTKHRNRFVAPSICGQLQIFLPLEEQYEDFYWNMVKKATIQEFDHALRTGTISPYRLDASYGHNMLFIVVASYGRADIFNYLDSQGVNYSALQQDYSVSLAVAVVMSKTKVDLNKMSNMLKSGADPSTLLANTIMRVLIYYERSFSFDSSLWFRMGARLKKLCTISYDTGPYTRVFRSKNLQWNLGMIPDIVQFLLEVGANSNAVVFGCSLLGDFLHSPLFEQYISAPEGKEVRKKILSALIEAGADVSFRDRYGDTVADVAWAWGHWDVWCEALQENGLSIQEVDHTKEQGWMLRIDDSDEEKTASEASESSSEYISDDDLSDPAITEHEDFTASENDDDDDSESCSEDSGKEEEQ